MYNTCRKRGNDESLQKNSGNFFSRGVTVRYKYFHSYLIMLQKIVPVTYNHTFSPFLPIMPTPVSYTHLTLPTKA